MESRRSMVTFCLSKIPHLDLLRGEGMTDAEFPREAYTRYRDYCLQGAGIRHPNGQREGHEQDASVDPFVDLCYPCRHALRGGRVPKASLVRLDPGPIPPGLLPLTIAEEQLLGVGRSCRYVFVMKPTKRSRWLWRGPEPQAVVFQRPPHCLPQRLHRGCQRMLPDAIVGDSKAHAGESDMLCL